MLIFVGGITSASSSKPPDTFVSVFGDLLYPPHLPFPRYQTPFVNSLMTLSCRASLTPGPQYLASILVNASNLHISTGIAHN